MWIKYGSLPSQCIGETHETVLDTNTASHSQYVYYDFKLSLRVVYRSVAVNLKWRLASSTNTINIKIHVSYDLDLALFKCCCIVLSFKGVFIKS